MRFDEQYERYLALAGQALQAQADAIFQDGSRVSEAARYSLFSGGKRVARRFVPRRVRHAGRGDAPGRCVCRRRGDAALLFADP